MGTAPDELAAENDLLEVLMTLGIQAASEVDGGHAIVIDVGGEKLRVAVDARGTPSPAGVLELVDRHRDEIVPRLLVANQLSSAAREILEGAGWSYLERRGHLRIWLERLRIDTRVEPLIEVPRRSALDAAAGRAVALCLLAADGKLSIRNIAAQIEMAVSTAATAVTNLREAALITQGSSEAVVPDLFWALADRWGHRNRTVSLLECPAPGDAARTAQLGLGLDDIEHIAGWALRGDQAAAAWGAPIPLRGDAPPDFYVPDDRTLRIARQLYGEAPSDARRAATVTLAPTPWTVTHRYDLAARQLARTGWPVVHPVVAALDLLLGGARGREILDDFDPPPGFRRVW